MSRFSIAGWACCGLLFWTCLASAQGIRGGVISHQEAARQGLTRAWITQVEIDPLRDKVTSLVQDGKGLLVQTQRGLLQLLDAETGGLLWVRQIGNRDYPSLPPAISPQYVAVSNGTTLFLLDRASGNTIWEKELRQAVRNRWELVANPIPSGSPAICPGWVCCPTFNGNMDAVNIKKPHLTWAFSSLSRIEMQPLVTRHALVWGTDRGQVYFASQEEAKVNFRLDTQGGVTAPLGYWPPMVIAASRDGYVYACNERTGQRPWRFPIGTAILNQPVAVEGSVYVVPEEGDLYSLAVDTGDQQWVSPGVRKFLAASQTRLYAADTFGRTLILDAKTGGRLGAIETHDLPIKLTNSLTDRLFLASATGLVTCLHEPQFATPFLHELPPEPPTDATKKEGAADPAVPQAVAPPNPAEPPAQISP